VANFLGPEYYHTVGFQIAEMGASPTCVAALVLLGGQVQWADFLVSPFHLDRFGKITHGENLFWDNLTK
jgi:hypothetical protein